MTRLWSHLQESEGFKTFTSLVSVLSEKGTILVLLTFHLNPALQTHTIWASLPGILLVPWPAVAPPYGFTFWESQMLFEFLKRTRIPAIWTVKHLKGCFKNHLITRWVEHLDPDAGMIAHSKTEQKKWGKWILILFSIFAFSMSFLMACWETHCPLGIKV